MTLGVFRHHVDAAMRGRRPGHAALPCGVGSVASADGGLVGCALRPAQMRKPRLLAHVIHTQRQVAVETRADRASPETAGGLLTRRRRCHKRELFLPSGRGTIARRGGQRDGERTRYEKKNCWQSHRCPPSRRRSSSSRARRGMKCSRVDTGSYHMQHGDPGSRFAWPG